MKIITNLVGVDKQVLIQTFDEVHMPGLVEHLRDNLVLDKAGIERVIPMLRAAYANGSKGVSLSFIVPEAEAKQIEELQSTPDGGTVTVDLDAMPESAPNKGLYRDMDSVTQALIDVLGKSYRCMLYALADLLAEQDERVYRRPRH